MSIKQDVTLLVHDAESGGNLILDTSGLRVDFDIRLIPEFSRASFVIYNLTEATIKSLMAGDRYVTLKTRLHNGKEYTIANRYYLSNATDELTLPDRITKLFCFDKLRKQVLEKQVNETVKNPSLENMITQVLTSAEHSGGIDFLFFPKGKLEEFKRPSRPMFGSVQQCIRRLEKEFNFETYTLDGGFSFMYKPSLDNVEKTGLSEKKPDVVLQTRAMRSNPKIGIASASINSNLDPRIRPTSVLDLSELLTVGADAEERTLQLTDNYLKSFSNYSKYAAFAVTHKGSNYTNSWNTNITALSPTKGKLMPTVQWANRTY